MRTVRLLTWFIFMLVYGLAIAPAAAQSTDNKLVIYSGRSEGLIAPILKQFSEETGIPVEVRYGGTAEMASTILEEGNNSPADVFIAQDAGALGALAAAGRLSKLPSDILERVAPKFQSGEELWVGVSGRARVLVYNTKLITADKLPASILDLTKPEWKDKVGWSPANGSFQANVTAMRIQLGEATTKKWLQDMIGNGVAAFENNDAIVQAVINGEIPVGLVNHYYVFEFKAQLPDAPVAVHNFKDGDSGALINVAGAGVLNTSKRAGLAQRLLLYLLGKKAQTYFAEKTGEYPLIEGVAADKSVKPLDQIKGPEVDLSKLSDLQGTLALLRDTGALP